ncbi:hypothetical protein [Kallotenue papyrolyticum]|nr:hypothetical protein [Kallotenue papyrolyticum]
MPRLEGERSNTGRRLILLFIVMIVVLAVLEYTGVLNLLPNVGAA